MPTLRNMLKISRPRFWVYVFGPYLIGLAAGAGSRLDLLTVSAIGFGVYFLLPANLLIYGVNDIFDFETDKLNPKKQGYETLLQPSKRRSMFLAIVLTNLPFIAAAFFVNAVVLFSLAGFILLSVLYSAPPIRAKAIPTVDSIFNALYFLPGILAYGLMADKLPPASAMIAAWLWTMAMHAYSAIPDIHVDTQAGIETVATLLGGKGTLVFCSACYLLSAIFAFRHLGVFAGILGLVYLTLMVASLFTRQTGGVYRIYKYFPIVNTACGFLIFWFVAIENLVRPG
jgi:4-hydroxybenzoate polyprenyltransferase